MRRERGYKMRWRKYNANPLGQEVDDCVIRAICTATKEKWEDVYKGLCDLGEKMCDMPSSNRVWGMYLKMCGYIRQEIPDSLPLDYSVIDFCRSHPNGKYILGLRGHVVAVIEGRYYDTWDSGERPVAYFWEIK